MPLPLAHHESILYKDKIYILGGTTESFYTGLWKESDRVFEFNPVDQTWQEMSRMPYKLGAIEGHRMDNMLYLVGDDTVNICRFNLDSLKILTSIEQHNRQLDDLFSLHPNHPNPFSGQTTIYYELRERGEIELAVYDMLGRKVTTLAKDTRLPGIHSLTWNTDGIDPGIYLCELRMGSFRQIIRMVKK